MKGWSGHIIFKKKKKKNKQYFHFIMIIITVSCPLFHLLRYLLPRFPLSFTCLTGDSRCWSPSISTHTNIYQLFLFIKFYHYIKPMSLSDHFSICFPLVYKKRFIQYCFVCRNSKRKKKERKREYMIRVFVYIWEVLQIDSPSSTLLILEKNTVNGFVEQALAEHVPVQTLQPSTSMAA